VAGADGQLHPETFLVDTGADKTVFSADFAQTAGLAQAGSPAGYALQGVSGNAGFTLVQATLQFSDSAGTPVRINGQFAAFTDPQATDMSILGRDVLNNFDVIVSRQRDEVLLLAPRHSYQVLHN
jgi:predicted aspartyl protease